jgi:hypothetical protein
MARASINKFYSLERRIRGKWVSICIGHFDNFQIALEKTNRWVRGTRIKPENVRVKRATREDVLDFAARNDIELTED